MKYSFLLLLLFFLSCKKEAKIKIAFLADVHLQDIHANFSDTNYPGVLHPKIEDYYTIRTMESQLHSTRLFNENYFAFLAALDDLVLRGIKLVALPGDFSDDGQPVHILALKKILTEYSQKHGMHFFLTTGNHDPVRPFSEKGAKYDFLGENGQMLAIVSDSSLLKVSAGKPQGIVTEKIKNWGYKEIAGALSNFGFFPKKEFLYWESPYTSSSYDTYDFETTRSQSYLDDRTYPMENTMLAIPDLSYLVEPVKDIWLLAIDANVYIPKEHTLDTTLFSGASMGYNNIIQYKQHLIPWVKKVVTEANRKGKTLIAFSHYPMVEFNDGASEELIKLFGEDKMQAHRVPKTMVSKIFAEAGIQVHFGGHMHMNDTGIFTSKKGRTLYNIQTPSLAAYPPAYKILTIHSSSELEVETVLLDTVANFKELFPLYEKEYSYLKNLDNADIWNENILNADTYGEFTLRHLEELLRLRFLEEDWPTAFKNKLLGLTGRELLLFNTSWNTLEKSALEDIDTWTGLDMVMDFYKLKNADELARKKIGTIRLRQYEVICQGLMRSDDSSLVLWGEIFHKTMNGSPSNHFRINLKSNTLEKL